MMAETKYIDPAVRRRNRMLMIVLLAVVLSVAAGGVLYLRHFGFSTEETQNKYH